MKTIFNYNSPVTDWVEGMPLGNGESGIMFFGTPKNETFMLNHDRLWQVKHKKQFSTAGKIDELRELVKTQQAAKANEVFQSTVTGDTACNSYQPFADLNFRINGGEVSGYERSLDIENAKLKVQYLAGKNKICFDAFCDLNSPVSRIRLTASEPTDFELFFTRAEDRDCTYSSFFEGDIFYFKGFLEGGAEFIAAIKLITDGAVSADKDVTVSGALSTELLIALSVSLKNDNPKSVCEAALNTDIGFDNALKSHSKSFSDIFNRCTIDLEHNDNRTAEEIYKAGQQSGAPELAWYEMTANMARYVLISSSQRGTLPCNLQGIWNREINPEWESGFTTDMNLQMYYWCANRTALSDCQFALFDWIDSKKERMAKLAKDIFGAEDAAYIPQYTDCFMEPTSWKDFGAFQVLWCSAAAWLAQNYYEYYLFTLDTDFLKHRALPFMKRCANLYLELLSEDENGRLRNYISNSPESFPKDLAQPLDTATMDIALIRELFGNIINGIKLSGGDESETAIYRDTLERLIDYPIDDGGTLLEWHDSREPADPGHRHLSHIYPLYPGNECFFDDELKRATVKAIDRRLAHNVGQSAEWSYAWYSCCFARLRNSEKMRECMQNLLIGAVIGNNFSVYSEFEDRRDLSRQYALGNRRIFQADGMLGYYAAVSESLMQCYGDRIVILPTLNKDWKNGKAKGLCAYDRIRLDIEWENGELKKLTLYPEVSKEITLELPSGERCVTLESGIAKSFDF